MPRVNPTNHMTEIRGYYAYHAPERDSMASNNQVPYVEIIEQPSPKALRFRYECEGRMAGSLPGASSTAENKTYPAIKVHNYKGEAVVVVSCVTKDKPYKPHPHSLVGKEGCSKGVCTIRFNNDSMICTFPNLGIQCIKKKGIDEALRVRESLRVDPFNTGFSHRSKDIDLNVVRLCFQVFVEGNTPGKFNRPLEAIVSEPILDKKAMCDLLISDLSHYASPCSGNQRVFLLCEKIVKDDIQIKLFDDQGWEAFAEFQHVDVWKQVAIKFKTPPYKYLDRSATVFIQLVRPSDGATSEPRQFCYYPVTDELSMEQRIRTRKQPRKNDVHVDEFISFNEGHILLQPSVSMHVGEAMDDRLMRHGTRPTARVKKEPVDIMGGGEVEVFPAPSYQPPMSMNFPLINQPGPSPSPYNYPMGSPGHAYNMQYAPSPETKYNPSPSPQYNINASPPYPPIGNTYQPSLYNINSEAHNQQGVQNIDLGSLPNISLSDSNLQAMDNFMAVSVDNLSASFNQNLSFIEEERKNNFDTVAGSSNKDQSNDLDKNMFRISAKDIPSGFSGLLSDDISTSDAFLRSMNSKSYNQLSSKPD